MSSQVLTRLRADAVGIADDAHRRLRTRLRLPLATLDAFFGGGLPCGAITEITGAVSAGRTTLARVLVGAALDAGECAAWIDLPNAFDPDDVTSSNVDLDRLLWVCPSDRTMAVRAVEHVLEAGGFRVVVLDLDGDVSGRSLPAAVWLRMGRAAARRDAAIVVLGPVHVTGPFATMSLEVSPSRRMFVGERGPSPVFTGTISALRIRKCRLGIVTDASLALVATTRV